MTKTAGTEEIGLPNGHEAVEIWSRHGARSGLQADSVASGKREQSCRICSKRQPWRYYQSDG